MITFEIKTKPKRQVDNAKDWAKEYSCNFLEAGVVSYTDVGQGVAYLKKETIQAMCPSFIGKPVLIDHYDVTPATFEKKAVGYVTAVWFNEQDGWFWCKFIVTDDKAKELIAKGYSVSCAFDVIGTAAGGEWHNIKYDEELTECAFTHLALVASPRYEECKIYMNSKGMGSMKKNANLAKKVGEFDIHEVGKSFVVMLNGTPLETFDSLQKAEMWISTRVNQDGQQQAEVEEEERKKELNSHASIISKLEKSLERAKKEGDTELIKFFQEELDEILAGETEHDEKKQTKKPWEVSENSDEFEVLERDRLQNIGEVLTFEVLPKNCPCGSGKIKENCPCGAKKNKTKENILMFGLKKKAKLNADNAFVVIDGERVSMKTLLNAKSEAAGTEIAADETIVIEGQEVSVSELVKSYQNAKKKDKKKDVKKDTPDDMEEDKENDDEEEKDKENDDEEEKENTSMAAKPEKAKTTAKNKMKKEDDDEEEAEEETKEHDKDDDEEKTIEKKNAHFTRLNSARSAGDAGDAGDEFDESLSGRVSRGNARYGSK
jgi:hypothetical protein